MSLILSSLVSISNSGYRNNVPSFTDNILSVSLSVHDSMSDVSSRVKYLNFNFGMLFIFPPN